MDLKQQNNLLSLETEHRDNLFASSHYPKPFCFNEDVARVFDDMVKRSIPSYQDVSVYLIPWVRSFFQNDTAIVDIGCSTGTALHCIASSLDKKAKLIGFDNSPAMIERANAKLAKNSNFACKHEIKLECADILKTSLPQASIVIMNYTLQFLPVASRLSLLKAIHEALLPGGMLFISEKLRSENPRIHEMKTLIYERFKQEQGYSTTEIERKKEALENVLVANTETELIDSIRRAGFSDCESVLKWNNFASLVALKDA